MRNASIIVGLRIDIDTLRGTRLGVPALLQVLARNHIKASFFFSVGPDNMGRHLWRLFRPAFLSKMVKSRAASLYGWDILLRGTFWPGPIIGNRCRDGIAATAKAGHEIGVHAWDHHRWQSRIAALPAETVHDWLCRGKDLLTEVTGGAVTCSAAPGWRCTDTVLLEKEKFGFRYNSDCRGHSIFYPKINGTLLTVPQIPTTLPTYDELIGRDGISDANYNQHLLSLIQPGQLNVLTIHAEVEGISRKELFQDFLQTARKADIFFCPLAQLLTAPSSIDGSTIVRANITGREGWVSCQQE